MDLLLKLMLLFELLFGNNNNKPKNNKVMRKTTNIITILTVVLAVLNIMTGMTEQLGISETVKNWIEFLTLALVAGMNIFSNVKSGEEVKELKQEVSFQKQSKY